LFLPKIGAPRQFTTLHDFLRNSNYGESEIQRRLDLPPSEEMDLIGLPFSLAEKLSNDDPLDLVIRLFLIGASIDRGDAERAFPPPAWEASRDLGLVESEANDPEKYFATIALYPVGDLFIISDRWTNPDGSPKPSFSDIVYPALSHNSLELLKWLPEEPCEAFLELCGGTGAAALQAAKLAKKTCAADITGRSAHFAKFNGALNGATNFESLEGDLYAAVKGQTFDRICAHPPYVPVLQPKDIYFGGGEDGEEITRRIIEELPDYLRPGGRLYCRTLGSDREGAPFEKRIREWLGVKQSEFDVAVFVGKNIEPFRFAVESAAKSGRGKQEVNDWRSLFGRHHIQDLLVGLIVIQRVNQPRPAFTVRRTLGEQHGRNVLDWILQWEKRMMQPGVLEDLPAMKPNVSPHMNLNIRHQVESGELIPRDFTLLTAFPFPLDTKLQPWMCSMICRCDGKHTIAELHEICKESGWIRPETPLTEFAKLFAVFISGGFLEVDEAKLPAAKE